MNSGSILIQTLGLAALLAGGAVAILLMRSWSLRRARDADAATPFTLQDLRQMRAAGQISEQEYRSMRAAVLSLHAEAPPEPTEHESATDALRRTLPRETPDSPDESADESGAPDR